MRLISDFHIHSRFAAACGKDINLDKLEKFARIKGINILGTGDFLHPKWNPEINASLSEDDNGILWSKNRFPFIWQTEVSLMYSQGGKGRRVHHLILAPDKGTVKQIIDVLGKRWRIDYDGRPIFGVSSIEFLEMMISINKDIEIIPAHAWTPWFSIFGSKSGFDSVEECFEEKSRYIHAIETGMSSDPAMNWRLSRLDKYNLVSFSDMHSFWPWRIGREATIFDLKELTYKNMLNAIRTSNGLAETIEVRPEYGKYHWDGHRACNITLKPAETKKIKGTCPRCKKPLTIGVDYRIEELADRPEGFIRKNAVPFKSLIPLTELISISYGIKQLSSKKVWDVYNKLIREFKNEFNILLNADKNKLSSLVDEKLVEFIIKNRENKLHIRPGYDGVYGRVTLEEKDEKQEICSNSQKSLKEYENP
jgi:uncharacterized protein (TIGR00375 family)